jgi:L-tartrate/succinate antiporter
VITETQQTTAVAPPAKRNELVRAAIPLAVGVAIALLPVPANLSPTAWHYFALFAAVIIGIVTEPIPPAAVGLAGVVLAAALGLVGATPAASANWALSGFGNTTVWLIFAAYMFAVGYAQTGLGRRISLQMIRALGARTLGLAYAITLADLVLAPFTPSITARAGGTIYPVIRGIPELYGSRPHDGSARKIGSYLMYTATATTLVTGSMFITALAPNALAVGFIAEATGLRISWWDWFRGFAPAGFTLLALVPLLLYRIYPPEIKEAPEAPRWAAAELRAMGPISRREITLLILVSIALTLWIGAAEYIDPAMAAGLVIVLMVVLRVVSWSDVIGYAQAWNVLIWFATLVTLASGLTETKFVAWLAGSIAPSLAGLGVVTSIVALVGVFYVLHYFFASITAHAATLFPVFLGIALTIPSVSPMRWALLLAYSLGLMGILTPYGGGHQAIYYGSGYVPGKVFWILGLILGVVYFVVYLAIALPWFGFLGF